MIYNYENDVVWKDALGEKRGLDKGYILNQLDNGNYTIESYLKQADGEKNCPCLLQRRFQIG